MVQITKSIISDGSPSLPGLSVLYSDFCVYLCKDTPKIQSCFFASGLRQEWFCHGSFGSLAKPMDTFRMFEYSRLNTREQRRNKFKHLNS